MATETTPTAATERYSVRMGARGRVILPASVRARLELQEGDRLVLTVEPDGTMRLVSLNAQIDKMMGHYKDIEPGRSLVDELISERREEARRESEA